jgi:hypothetical protein
VGEPVGNGWLYPEVQRGEFFRNKANVQGSNRAEVIKARDHRQGGNKRIYSATPELLQLLNFFSK